MSTPSLPLDARLQAGVARLVGRLPGALARGLSFAPPLMIDGHTLDPHVQGIRALRAPLHRHGLCQPTVAIGRLRYVREAVALRTAPTAVRTVRDLQVTGANGPLEARLYTPAEPTADLLVYFHGGGFVLGDLDTHDEPCRLLCRDARTQVLSVAYRLAPEHPFPAPVEDAIAAVRWAGEQAASLGATRVSVGGDSAGGCLATVAARALAASPHTPAAQLLVYPLVEAQARTRSHELFGRANLFLTDADCADFVRHYAAAPEDQRASPLRSTSFSDQPPALVVTAGFDILRDEGRAYARALRTAGTETRELTVPTLVHGFLHMTPVVPAAAEAVQAIAAAWRTLLDTLPIA
jgi:acetyl esterase